MKKYLLSSGILFLGALKAYVFDEFINPPKEKNSLRSYRKTIDDFDYAVIDLLAKRKEVVRKIGQYKQTKGMDPLQNKRWKDLLISRIEYGKERGLSSKFIEKVWNEIHNESLSLQYKMKKKEA
ncbi:MAG: chorismate mutase [Hyphomicrobiales bacterium]